jgi:acylphosphatase
VKFTLLPLVVFTVKSASIEPEEREVLKLFTVTVANEAGQADDIHANRSLKQQGLIMFEYMNKLMEKCFNIKITGKVQDIGFRTLIEDIAKIYDLRGFAFNDIDNSVKMVCCGENGSIPDFLEEIKDKGALKGVVIDNITIEEIPFKIFLPAKFMRLYTDELSDISRKLDVGVDVLINIKEDTKVLPDIKNGIDTLNTKFDSFIIEQKEHNMRMDEHNMRMDEHNMRLEKILLKLAEK